MEDRSNQVGCELHRLEHMMSKNLEMRVKAEGIDEVTLMHGWIMRFLYENREKEVYQKDLERYFHIGRSTVTNTIQLMEKRGFIRRESVERDARLKKVLLTEKGVQSHEKIEELITELNDGILDGIEEKDVETFIRVLYIIRENVEKKMPKRGKEESNDPDFIERSKRI